MNSMSEYMSRSFIKEKIDDISEKFFDFTIKDDGVRSEVENDMYVMLKTLIDELAKHGELKDVWPMAIAYLIDTLLAQLIVVKLQNKYIEEFNKDESDG